MSADTEDRILPLDVMRGVAILGVVLANVGAIALPRALDIQPAFGMDGGLGAKIIWCVQLLLVDGKMNALLAMLFGASTLLVIDRAEMDGADGYAAQHRRLRTLIFLGALHYLLIWQGDLLMLLGLSGAIALRLVAREPIDLVKWAFIAFGVQLLILIGGAAQIWLASPDAYARMIQRGLFYDLAMHQGSYGAILQARVDLLPRLLLWLGLNGLPEMTGFALLGMAMAKGGFFFAQWTQDQYARTARHAYLFGLIPTLALAIWALVSHDPRTAETVVQSASFPFRIPIAIGHASLLAWLCARVGAARPLSLVAAVGRLSLSNYLLASLVLTTIFYGYGAGYYARFGRVELLAIALGCWVVMLLWSPLWLRYVGRGPAERLWHALRTMRRGQ